MKTYFPNRAAMYDIYYFRTLIKITPNILSWNKYNAKQKDEFKKSTLLYGLCQEYGYMCKK